MVRVPFNVPAASGQCDPCRTPPAQSRLNLPSLLYVLVVESDITAASSRRRPAGDPNYRRIPMFARLDATPPPQNADVIMRAVGAVALAALAMIHVIDLPGTLGLAALSVETLLILLVALAAWQARARAANLPPRPHPAARRVPEYSQPR